MKYQVCRPLTPIEYNDLKSDIAENGVLVPIEVDEDGNILDGHHRVQAWTELRSGGVKLPDYPRIIRAGLTEEQKRDHAIKLNAFRRQLTDDERSRIVDRLVRMRKDGMSYRKIGEAVGMSDVGVMKAIKTGANKLAPEEMPKFVTGADGKQYPAKQERRPLPPNATTLTLLPPLASSILQPKPPGDVVRSEVRFVPAKPFSETEHEEMSEELAEDGNSYDWMDEEEAPARKPAPIPTMLLATNAKQQDKVLSTLKAAKDTAPDIFEQVRSGDLSAQDAKREMKKRENDAHRKEILAKYDDIDQWDGDLRVNTISLGNICNLQLPSESVDMVFTDPPYHDEYVDLYEQLARVADVALKPGGYLMTYAGKMFIPEIIKHLSAKLEYVSIYAVFQPFSQARIVKHNIFENWRPILIFKKPGKTEVKEWAQDVVRGTRDKSHHEWQQDSEAPLQYIAAYTKPGDIVLDPFVGGGTTPWSCKQLGRYYVCFDTNEDAVKLSMERLANG
jgi:DNA modification methylase